MIGMVEMAMNAEKMSAVANLDLEHAWWRAVQKRDRDCDGEFFFAVSSTGVYCRPSCPAKRPRRENVAFFPTIADAEKAGYRACLRCRPKASLRDPQAEFARQICRYIEQHLEETVTLTELGRVFQQSPFHLQRTFKRVMGITPRAYTDTCRMKRAKQQLRTGHSVTNALYDAGYGSSSRLYERTASHLGMSPGKYRNGAIAILIRYTCTASPLGRMLIAATERGICSIQFAGSDDELESGLKREFPFAVRHHDDAALISWKENLLAMMSGQPINNDLPLDIQATAFQRRVWEYLQTIPRGETRSYSEVAKAIHEPKAVRAVARACASNPVAIAIPCHRVLRSDGGIAGYRWGVRRKQKLLQIESGAVN